MRHFFRNLPIGRKLTLTIMVLSSVALLLSGITLAIYEQVSLRRMMERDFAILTDIFDDNVASGLAFNDAVSIGQTLKTLQPHQRIVAAGVYDRSGVLVAHYRRSGAADGFVFPTDRLTGQRIEGKRLDTFKDVVLAGEKIGVVYISAGLDELRERAWIHAGLVGGLLIACSLVTLILTARVQRVISGPIEALAHTMATVTAEKNFTLRAQKQSEDELGRLIDGFNEMLVQIQARDTALQQTHDELEDRVRMRTRELQQAQAAAAREKDRLQLIFESVPVGICLTNILKDGQRDRLINRAHLAICGLTREEAVEGVFNHLTHPEDAPRQKVLRQQLDAGLIPQFSLEKRYIKPDGQTVWVVYTVQRRSYGDGGWEELSTVVDITALKQAQEEAAHEQARFKFIFESVPVGISLVAADEAKTRLVNPAHERITGVSAADSSLPGVFMRASHPDDDRRQMEAVQPFIRGDVDHYTIEKRYVRPDGRHVWAVLTSRKFTDPATGLEQSVTTLVDITERKESEAKLAEASGLLEAMLENSPDFIYFKDRESRFVRCSNAVHQRLGVSGPEQIRGRRDADFFGPEHADQTFLDEQVIIRTGRPIVGQLERETYSDKPDTWVLTTKMPWRDGTGAILGIFGISKDVTALKQAESRLAYERDQLRSLLQSSPDTIYFKDRESRFVRVSHSKVRKTIARLPQLKDRRQPDGREMAEEDLLKGLTDFDTYDDADARRAFEDEQEIIRTGLPIAGKLEKQTYLDGSVLWNLSNKMAWRDGEGKIIGTFGISKDITPLKEAEEKLAQMHRQLLEVSRQAGMAEVATGVLHNVGNVLNSVNVSATLVIDQIRESKATNLPKLCAMLQEHAGDLGEFLTRDPKGSRIPSYLITLAGQITVERQAVVEELGQLRKNVDHIKDIVAMQQSYAKVSGVSETVRVSELVEDALRMNASAISRHGLDVVRDYASDDPPVTVERHKVLQVLVNLIRNAKHACDASGRSDKQLIVRIVRDEARIRVSVIDNGVGIPPENLTRIFAHGFTTKKDGHGFGLHSGALVAHELGGSLSAHSDGRGKGATFTLELPCESRTISS